MFGHQLRSLLGKLCIGNQRKTKATDLIDVIHDVHLMSFQWFCGPVCSAPMNIWSGGEGIHSPLGMCSMGLGYKVCNCVHH